MSVAGRPQPLGPITGTEPFLSSTVALPTENRPFCAGETEQRQKMAVLCFPPGRQRKPSRNKEDSPGTGWLVIAHLAGLADRKTAS